MKETVNANIGTEAFTIDVDAYSKLKSYLDEIRIRLPEHDMETISDIELRIAELFRERVATPMQVVTIAMVDDAARRMGAPADFGERRNATSSNNDSETGSDPTITTPRKLFRSHQHRSIAGVCSGIGDYLNIDPTLIRAITLLGIFLGGISLWAYVLLWIIIPEAPLHSFDIKNKKL